MEPADEGAADTAPDAPNRLLRSEVVAMISLDRLGDRGDVVRRALNAINDNLSARLGKQVLLSLESSVDEPTLERMLELEEEVFSIEENVYTRQDILECLAEEDSLLMLLRVDGRIEGYVFGYDEDPDQPAVKGTDYFLDSALVSTAYEQKGIGASAAGVVLLVIYARGYRDVGITTEVKDKTGRELVKFYEKLGFVRAVTDRADDYAMKIGLNDEIIAGVCAKLGLAQSRAGDQGDDHKA